MTTDYQGGYLLHDTQIVRGTGHHAHSAADLTMMGDYAVEALNHVQETPWEVNLFVLATVEQFIAKGENVTDKKGDVLFRIEAPQDPRRFNQADLEEGHPMKRLSKQTWKDLTSDQKSEQKKKQSKFIKRYEEQQGEFSSFNRTMALAQEMQEFEFYYPHNMDFRSRMYPVPTDMTPQGDDLSKGLLRFANEERLGPDGLYWLGFMVTTNWGKDKLHPDDRFDFANDGDFMDCMARWIDDPIENRGWLEADKPLQFLAVAHEWVWANRYPNPEEFMSKVPGNLDGSCNGAQHLSILMRDEQGARSTNCMSSNSREDLYRDVADLVYEEVHALSNQGDEQAREWLPKLSDPDYRRKLVKRSVMTVPYGVTEYGVAKHLINDGFATDNDGEKHWGRAAWLRDIIWQSIGTKLKAGRHLQRYFQACAQVCAENNKPMIWETPAGFKVTQAYYEMVQSRIRTLNTRFIVYKEVGEAGMKEDRMVTAAAPNVIHSCDAAHLQITVCRMAQAGIKSFSMVHDSFGCHMGQMTLMRNILRDSIVDMYQGNYLQKWKESVEHHTGLDMPEIPELGNFDMSQIRQSVYFFS